TTGETAWEEKTSQPVTFSLDGLSAGSPPAAAGTPPSAPRLHLRRFIGRVVQQVFRPLNGSGRHVQRLCDHLAGLVAVVLCGGGFGNPCGHLTTRVFVAP